MIVRSATVLLALGASLGGLYGGTVMGAGAGAAAAPDPEERAPANILRTELMATPLITGGRIYGYVIGRYVIAFDADLAAERELPLETLVSHGVNDLFFERADETFWVNGPLGVTEIAGGLEQAINAVAGGPLVTGLSVRQLDYLQSPEIRQPVISFDR